MTKNESKLNVNVTFKGHNIDGAARFARSRCNARYARVFWMIQNTENIGCFFCLCLSCRPLHLACLVYHTSTAAASILKRSCFSALLKSPVALPGFAGLGAAWPGHIAVRPPFYSALRWRVWIFATRVACAAALLCVCYAASQFYRWRIKLRGQNHFSFAQQQWCFPSTSQHVRKRLFFSQDSKKIC